MTPEMTVIIPLLMSAAETKLKSKLTFPTNAKMSAPNIRGARNAGYTEAGDNEKFENEQNDADDEKQYFPVRG